MTRSEMQLNRVLHRRPYQGDPNVKALHDYIQECWKRALPPVQGPFFDYTQPSGTGKTKMVMQLARRSNNPYWVMHIDCKDNELVDLMHVLTKDHFEKMPDMFRGWQLGEKKLTSAGLSMLGNSLAVYLVGFIRYVLKHQDDTNEMRLSHLLCYPETPQHAEQIRGVWREIISLAERDYAGMEKLRNRNFVVCFDNASGLYKDGIVDKEHSHLISALRKASVEMHCVMLDDLPGRGRIVFMFVDSNPRISTELLQ